MIITILVDNPNSWALLHAQVLERQLKCSHRVLLVNQHENVLQGDIAIILSCEKLVKPAILSRNKYNLVAHASDLPKGKGMSPLTWQILEGKNNITVTLFEAVEKVDAGKVYSKATLKFEGHELIEEMQDCLGIKINEMIIEFIDKYPNILGIEQSGEETFYQRRNPSHSELDPSKTIAEQFNLLRVVNNEKYPAFFYYQGKKYILKIFKND